MASMMRQLCDTWLEFRYDTESLVKSRVGVEAVEFKSVEFSRVVFNDVSRNV